MKICIPTIRAERVGTVVSTATDYLYDCPDRPNVYGEVTEAPLIERKLTAKVVFDRDLRVAARLAGAGRLILWTVMLAVYAPLLVPYLAAKGVEASTEWVADRLASLADAAGIRRHGIRATYRALAREVVAK